LTTGIQSTNSSMYTSGDMANTQSSNGEKTKYDVKVMEILRSSLGVDNHSTELDNQIHTMKRVEVMDNFLKIFGGKLMGREVREAVQMIFGIDLEKISANNYGNKLSSYDSEIIEALRLSLNLTPDSPKVKSVIMNLSKVEVMDRFMEIYDFALTGPECRVLINQIFGVNLDGLSRLEHKQLSIYSKGAWVLQNDEDLFFVSSSFDDASLYVDTTTYYKELIGTDELPATLEENLIQLGFTYDESAGYYTYTNSIGESVPDTFKTQTIGAVIQAIQEINANL